MAIMIAMEFSGVTRETYDAVMKELGLDKKAAKWPKGVLSHTAGATEGGWHVVDVWQSKGDFDKFVEKQLKPAFAKVGGLPEPRVTVSQVHYRKTVKA